MQNVKPSSGELGKKIREAFFAPPGHKLIVVDYEQMEMRLLAHFANETTMIQAIKDGKDIHAVTASNMYSVPYAEIVAAKCKSDGKWEKAAALLGVPSVEPVVTPRDKELIAYRTYGKTIGFGGAA